ncbi:MAG: hypothetical protein LBG58_12720, partial [Planctomycetaceae bacterium]|nr:hypothetical protein [Planctomycetaceae bacterium]
IFRPHRKHLYQLLANEKQIPHLIISSMYMAVQGLLIIGYLVCLQFNETVILCYIVFSLIVTMLQYIIIKKRIVFVTIHRPLGTDRNCCGTNGIESDQHR